MKKLLFLFIISAMVFTVAFFLSRTSNAQTEQQVGRTVSATALQQIQALTVEKESRTPAQKKIDSQLLFAAKMRAGVMIADGVPILMVDVGADEKGLVEVAITALVDESLLSQLAKLGVEVKQSFPAYHSVSAVMQLERIEDVASLDQVQFIQPKPAFRLSQQKAPRLTSGFSPSVEAENGRAPGIAPKLKEAIDRLAVRSDAPAQAGSVSSEGDITHRALSARGTFNVDGSGIKIGVLSDGVSHLVDSQSTGDLGPVTVLETAQGDEGTAMLEIIHDLAPGAQLYFASATSSIAGFAQNIRALRSAGCDIIVDDVIYYQESTFQDGQARGVFSNTNGGIITQAVNDVVADGALYFSAAGNQGNKNDSTSAVWEGDFVNGGPLSPTPPNGFAAGNVNDFDPTGGVAQFETISVAGIAPVTMSWADPLGGSANDYDFYVIGPAGDFLVAASTNFQTGTQDPYEAVVFPYNFADNSRVVIVQKPGAANRFLHLDVFNGQLAFSTNGEIHGHAAASRGIGVAAVAAVPTYPAFFGPANEVELFSSDGPRRIFFGADGSPVTPGNFSSTGGMLLQQPLIAAADGVRVTGVGGFPDRFYGTSAAAPHAAAMAALIKSGNPALTSTQIKNALTSTAKDIEGPGIDPDSGNGIVMPYPALQSLGGPIVGKAFLEVGTVTQTETCCNGDGFILPGEAGEININLKNSGLLTASGITTTLFTATPGVTIHGGSSAYPDIAPQGASGNLTPFSISLASNLLNESPVKFTLTINYNGGHLPSQQMDLDVRFGFQPEPFRSAASSSVYGLAMQPDGKVLVGGNFAGFAGLGFLPSYGIGRLNGDGTRDTAFDPGCNQAVIAIAVQPDGKIIIGGGFTALGNHGLANAKRLRIGRLNSDGTLDTGFDPGIDPPEDHIYATVQALLVQPDGKILVGGEFGGLGGQPRGNIGRLNPDGSIDPGFNPGTNWPVLGFALQPDSKIIVVGSFDTIGGGGLGNVQRKRIARLNPDGSVDQSFDYPGGDMPIGSVVLQTDGRILIGGDITDHGVTGTTAGVGRLNPNGSLDSSFAGAPHVDARALGLQTDQRIIVSGLFASIIEPYIPNFLAKLEPDGGLNAQFSPGANDLVEPIAQQSNGMIMAGGDFTMLGGGGWGMYRQDRVGRVSNTSLASNLLSVDFSGTTITWLRGGTSPEVYRVTFETSPDGANYTPLGNGTRINGGWKLAGVSLGAGDRFIRARGFYTTGSHNGSGSIVETILNRGPVTNSISGRVVSPFGIGLRNATVFLTDSHGGRQMATTSSFGFYTFDNVPAGDTYTVGVFSRLYRFAPRSLELVGDLANLDFQGLE